MIAKNFIKDSKRNLLHRKIVKYHIGQIVRTRFFLFKPKKKSVVLNRNFYPKFAKNLVYRDLSRTFKMSNYVPFNCLFLSIMVIVNKY